MLGDLGRDVLGVIHQLEHRFEDAGRLASNMQRLVLRFHMHVAGKNGERLARKVGSFDSERQVINCLREELSKVLPELEESWSAA